MKSEVFYFAGYVCVLNKKIYDESYYKMISLIQKEDNAESILQELLKILGDDEDKISLETVLNELQTADDSDKDAAMLLGLDVALSDDYWADDEKTFFDNAYKKLNYSAHTFDELFKTMKAAADQTIEADITTSKKLHGKAFYAFMEKITSGNLKDRFKQRYINCLLSGQDYSDSIKSMREISKEDITYAKEALIALSDKLNLFLHNLQESQKKVKLATGLLRKENNEQDIEQSLNGIKQKMIEIVNQVKEQVNNSLQAHEIAAKYYTIAFMGRTKAGKSTLHSVVLGGLNKEFIGVGKERTTRLNRIYKWNGIRIIDTPGIGAPGGKSDVDIAKSIVDESDLICYVVTSDSIQETEFAFLKELKDRNKPIVILLNKKENLLHPVHRKKFLENPLHWYERTDNNAIEGHLIRIKEYAEKYYNNAYFDIFPVQLMAAQLAMNETDAGLKKTLYSGSRLQQFLDNLRVQILINGKIKRSQTMLNGTIYSLVEYKRSFESHIAELKALQETLRKQSHSALKKIKKAGEDSPKRLKEGIETLFDDFIQNDIRRFANEHYDLKEDALNAQWKKYFKQTGFESRIKDRVERESELYKNEVENILKSFSENLSFAFETINVTFNITDTFDMKAMLAIGGSILGLVGGVLIALSNPIGWALAIGGLAVGLFSALFKSKAEKIREAQDKLYESIKNSFEENRNATISGIVENFTKMVNKTESTVEKLFTTLDSVLTKLINDLAPLKEAAGYHESVLNKLYAIRILNFAKNSDRFNIDDQSLLSRISVEHDFAKTLKIKTDLVNWIDTEKLTHILQEDIILEAL